MGKIPTKIQKAAFSTHLLLVVSVLAGSILLGPGSAMAAGTLAGTDILNQAMVNYEIAGIGYTEESNIITTTVAELLNVNCVWQDAANVVVSPGDVDTLLAFRVTNTGNGFDEYFLDGLSVLGGDDFDPLLASLYLDTDGDGFYDSNVDTQYQRGLNDPVLAADEGIDVFVLNDIPLGLSDGELGDSRLTATSKTGTGAPGTVILGAGEKGTDAVIGTTGGRDYDTGTLVISSASISIVKSAVVTNSQGDSEATSGATIAYTLAIRVAGSGTALDVVVTDTFPADTTYTPGTLVLNGTLLTDAADSDAGDAGATNPGALTVHLGDMPVGSPVSTITFEVKIN
jgi:uncharacterized repeat protein (TIGR01451 family)